MDLLILGILKLPLSRNQTISIRLNKIRGINLTLRIPTWYPPLLQKRTHMSRKTNRSRRNRTVPIPLKLNNLRPNKCLISRARRDKRTDRIVGSRQD
jgi:hypothetical protein